MSLIDRYVSESLIVDVEAENITPFITGDYKADYSYDELEFNTSIAKALKGAIRSWARKILAPILKPNKVGQLENYLGLIFGQTSGQSIFSIKVDARRNGKIVSSGKLKLLGVLR